MLDVHADALERVSAAYHEFLLRYKASANVVYGIVEGKEDPLFYRGLIERQLPEGWEVELIPAGRKDNVLKAITAFDWTRFSPKRVCFFVDRDLSDLIPESIPTVDNLYTTDNYSIENDVVNFGVFKRLLEEVLNISGLRPEEVEIVKQHFEHSLTFFKKAMLSIMTQVLLWRRSGRRVCLNDIRPKDFFIFSDGNIKLRTEFESALSRLQHAANCVNLVASSEAELSKAEAEFRYGQGPDRFIRGKYLLWFLVELSFEVHRSISSLLSRFKAPPKVRVSIGPGNAIVVLAPRARCPGSLQLFLERTFCQHIRESAL
jgi:hypothetical protein